MTTVDERRREMLSLLAKHSLRYDSIGFLLSSGKQSHWYLDCKTALSHARFRQLIGEMIAERIRDSMPTVVGGLELGSYPIATAVSDALFLQGRGDVRAFIVRKAPKKHGLQRFIEGDVRPSDRAIIVDDVITTGSSTLDAYKHVKDAGLQVLKIVAIVDREEENGRQNIEQNSMVEFEALCTLSDIKLVQEHEQKYPAGDSRANQERSDGPESSGTSPTR